MSNFTWSMFDAFHERVNVKESLWEKHEPVLFCNFKPEGLRLNTVVQVNEKIQVFDVSNNPILAYTDCIIIKNFLQMNKF